VSAATLTVITVSKPYFHEPLHNKTVTEGQPVVLECRFNGEPQPQITWYKNHQVMAETAPNYKILVEQGYSCLEVHQLHPQDTGTFTVSARNLAGETRTSCLLNVEGRSLDHVIPAKPVFKQPLVNIKAT
jgi:hypothetical protein